MTRPVMLKILGFPQFLPQTTAYDQLLAVTITPSSANSIMRIRAALAASFSSAADRLQYTVAAPDRTTYLTPEDGLEFSQAAATQIGPHQLELYHQPGGIATLTYSLEAKHTLDQQLVLIQQASTHLLVEEVHA